MDELMRSNWNILFAMAAWSAIIIGLAIVWVKVGHALDEMFAPKSGDRAEPSQGEEG